MQQNLGKYSHVHLASLAYQMLDELGLTCVQSSFIKDPVAASFHNELVQTEENWSGTERRNIITKVEEWGT